MEFPKIRMRRLRRTEGLREMVRETQLDSGDFIYPLFVVHGKGIKEEISSMPGNYHFSVDELVKEAKDVYELGIPAVLLFGIPHEKDEVGSESYSQEGIIQQAVRALKQSLPELMVITDVCMCEYTSHGHCGVVKEGTVQNDQTLDLLTKQAITHARAGADMVAPSDMMDGRVGAIRKGLDEAGYSSLPIMAYSAKFASSFYGPFREAAECAPQYGDRKSYQMDPANGNEAMREAELDIREGADIVMVKPALAYLDLIYRIKTTYGLPTAAYQVSGEFSMIRAADAKGWIDGERVMMESLTSIKRAGADLIITYFAKSASRLLGKQGS